MFSTFPSVLWHGRFGDIKNLCQLSPEVVFWPTQFTVKWLLDEGGIGGLDTPSACWIVDETAEDETEEEKEEEYRMYKICWEDATTLMCSFTCCWSWWTWDRRTRRVAVYLETHCNIGLKWAFPTSLLERWHNCLLICWRNVAQLPRPHRLFIFVSWLSKTSTVTVNDCWKFG